MKSVEADLVTAGLSCRVDALAEEVAALRTQLAALAASQPENRTTLCLISDDFEKVLTVLMLAHAAAAAAMETEIYFAFWGVQAVKRGSRYQGKPLLEKALTAILKRNIRALPSSKFHFAGLGPAIFSRLMNGKGMATPEQLMETALEAGIVLRACATSMEILGIALDELLPGVTCAGATAFLEAGTRSRVSLIL